jgi:hypothetical protein
VLVASCVSDAPSSGLLRGRARELARLVSDVDDGIHVSSVTRVEVSGKPVVRAVVSWLEHGVWVARTVELGEISPVPGGWRHDAPPGKQRTPLDP